MGGQLYLEQEKWQLALVCVESCLAIVQPLATVGSLEQMDLFGTRADACEQAARFCKYNLGAAVAEPAAAEAHGGLTAGESGEVGTLRVLV
jgi:hypothetical protein